jgi:hypothetical protein
MSLTVVLSYVQNAAWMSPCTYHSHTSTTLDLRYQVPVGPMVYDCPVQLSCSVQLSVLYLLSPYCGTSTGIVGYYYTMYLLLTILTMTLLTVLATSTFNFTVYLVTSVPCTYCTTVRPSFTIILKIKRT